MCSFQNLCLLFTCRPVTNVVLSRSIKLSYMAMSFQPHKFINWAFSSIVLPKNFNRILPFTIYYNYRPPYVVRSFSNIIVSTITYAIIVPLSEKIVVCLFHPSPFCVLFYARILDINLFIIIFSVQTAIIT